MKNKTNTKHIVRCDRAGVFYGEIKTREGAEAVLTNVRQIHCWQGAASLMQLSQDGLSHRGSRVTVVVPELTVLGVIEILPCSEKAIENLDSAPVWRV